MPRFGSSPSAAGRTEERHQRHRPSKKRATPPPPDYNRINAEQPLTVRKPHK